MFYLKTILLILMVFSESIIGNEEATEDNALKCPRECTCENAPLRSASFVLTWMTSWGEEDLPDLHPNEILSADMLAPSDTASDADVDVDVIGLHATCSLHSTTNVTTLLASLPSSTMVLSILQAPGCNFTVVDGGQLVGLNSLKALHLQGYAHIKEKQVSGFEPNKVSDMIAHKKFIEQELKKKEGQEKFTDLRLALAEDALQPLNDLQLLDLQYVRLVASKEARRSRRYSKEPVAATTLLDMPLKQFLTMANKVDSFYFPPYLQQMNQRINANEDLLYDDDNDDEDYDNMIGESYRLQRKLFPQEKNPIQNQNSLKHAIESENIAQDLKLMKGKDQISENGGDSNIVPYSIYKAEMQPQLAPFKKLNKLKYLRVAHAQLDRIGAELLDGLLQLHTLTLEHNKIKIIPAGLFAPTPNLRHLSLAYNNVLLLDPDSLNGLSRLLTIDLDHNQLSVLGPATFPALSSLKTLRINENPLTHLLPDTFATLNSTENIYLGSRNISMDVHINSFRFLSNVNSIVINNISMESLQKSLLIGMPRIQELTIHGKIPEIDYDAFSTTPDLRSLNLSYCHLTVLSLDAFFGLRQLTELDISNNELVALSPGTFDHLSNLRKLYLNNNLLTTLPLGIFIPIPAKLIQLHNNPWYCTCDLLQLRPSITNKIERPGQILCEWDEKLSTVCKKSKKRLVYDARVAPLCHEPAELTGTEIYHAALRHLKCSKYHWDPRLLQKENVNATETVKKSNKQKKIEKKNEKNDNNVSWLPLSAFTPEPIDTEDLLEIAEGEGLEEVIELSTENVENRKSTSEDKMNKKEIDESLKEEHPNPVHQNDEPSTITKQTTIIPEQSQIITNPSTIQYKPQRTKINFLKSKFLKKKLLKNKISKHKYDKEKMALKAIIAAKQKQKQKQNEDDLYRNNFIRTDNLKNNIDF